MYTLIGKNQCIFITTQFYVSFLVDKRILRFHARKRIIDSVFQPSFQFFISLLLLLVWLELGNIGFLFCTQWNSSAFSVVSGLCRTLPRSYEPFLCIRAIQSAKGKWGISILALRDPGRREQRQWTPPACCRLNVYRFFPNTAEYFIPVPIWG